MRNRGIVFVIVMSIITLGIYDIYWAFSTRDELVKKGYDVPSPWIAIAPLLGLIGIAVLQILLHALWLGGPSASAETIVNVLSVIIGFVSVVAIIPMSVFWLWKYCQAVEKVTHKGLTAGFNIAMAILLAVLGAGPLWVPIVQYQYNKLSR
jgi:hypothetical protein